MRHTANHTPQHESEITIVGLHGTQALRLSITKFAMGNLPTDRINESNEFECRTRIRLNRRHVAPTARVPHRLHVGFAVDSEPRDAQSEIDDGDEAPPNLCTKHVHTNDFLHMTRRRSVR